MGAWLALRRDKGGVGLSDGPLLPNVRAGLPATREELLQGAYGFTPPGILRRRTIRTVFRGTA